MIPQGLPPRVPAQPIAQLLQSLPPTPAPDKNAYNATSTEGDKGGLPMEICAFAQGMYAMPQPPGGGKPSPLAMQPGWGGQGR